MKAGSALSSENMVLRRVTDGGMGWQADGGRFAVTEGKCAKMVLHRVLFRHFWPDGVVF